LYAAAASSKHWLIFSRPTCLARLIPATVLAHPKNSSTSFHRRWLFLNPAERCSLRTNHRAHPQCTSPIALRQERAH
jgi:hypothetical protein